MYVLLKRWMISWFLATFAITAPVSLFADPSKDPDAKNTALFRFQHGPGAVWDVPFYFRVQNEVVTGFVNQNEINGGRETFFDWQPETPEEQAPTQLLSSIGEGGKFREHLTVLLNSASLDGSQFDKAVENGKMTWHDGGWGHLTQTKINDYIVYVAFNKNNNNPTDAAVIRYVKTPSVEYLSKASKAALEFRANRKYAHCGQQALLDAGFDPKGVDGAPGKGAQTALGSWAEANSFQLPLFSQETASQVCYALTAPEVVLDGEYSLGAMPIAPGAGWNGWTDSVSSAEAIVLHKDGVVRRIVALNFRDGVTHRYVGNGVDQQLRPPFTMTGTFITHGNDMSRHETLLALLENDEIGAIEAYVRGKGVTLNGTKDDLRFRPDMIDARWSIIGETGAGADVVVADFKPIRNRPEDRIVIVFLDGEGTSNDKLLYGWLNRSDEANMRIRPVE
ncbi:hypothetical protein GS636_06785 [Ruegeria sp. HKCCD4884]|uniref:hypothetical protein n=1 Tax=Ruegeria sp. HKCCD4884 TaxID=2683022 RepID=UPI001491D96D|nr:hypothetical protein [Ruegeria sp. HKCCD4884]NOD92487.1 hypothetical protein [Ruegeria sp. HKCCD4884]